MVWTVVQSSEPDPEKVPLDDVEDVGMDGFLSKDFMHSEILAQLFLLVMFKDWKEKVILLNDAIAASKANVKRFSNQEFLVALGLLIGAADFSQVGKNLFSKDDKKKTDDIFTSIAPQPHFETYMPYSRFKDFRRYLPDIFADQSLKGVDPWYQFSGAIKDFNDIRRELYRGSRWIVADESMSAWRPRQTALGGLPNISFIMWKPEPLGAVFFSFILFNCCVILLIFYSIFF
jgi:hypothetical protein